MKCLYKRKEVQFPPFFQPLKMYLPFQKRVLKFYLPWCLLFRSSFKHHTLNQNNNVKDSEPLMIEHRHLHFYWSFYHENGRCKCNGLWLVIFFLQGISIYKIMYNYIEQWLYTFAPFLQQFVKLHLQLFKRKASVLKILCVRVCVYLSIYIYIYLFLKSVVLARYALHSLYSYTH